MISLLDFEPAYYESKLVNDELEIGKISQDQSAVKGLNGNYFIFKGSNSYIDAYYGKADEGIVQGWYDLFKARYLKFNDLGIDFYQFVIPNKLSLLNSYFPFGNDFDFYQTPIHKKLDSSNDNPSVFFLYEDFKKNEYINCIWRKNDSHLTLYGSCFLIELLLKKIGISLPNKVDKIITKDVTIHGDLSGKFLEKEAEVFKAPLWNEGFLNQDTIKLSFEVIKNGNTGTVQNFNNSQPIIDKKVMVFGNSFLEKNPSWGASPLLAKIFKEYTFIWSSEIDFSLIEKYRPDIVIFQTVERFLSKVPAI